MQALLELLKDGHFHSGEELGRLLGVSRTAVWKQLQQLERDFSIRLHRVRGKGYRLPGGMRLLDPAVICSASPWPVEVLLDTDSTNAQVVRELALGRCPPFVILAERQTGGRGRRGRSWSSPFAENLYFSLVLEVEGGFPSVEGLSLVAGVAVLRALHAFGVLGAGLKWPNDVLVGDAKLAGILLELYGDPADICRVVFGIGINANMLSADLERSWTSVRRELGEPVDRSQLALMLARQLHDCIALHKTHGFEPFRSEWERYHLWQGRKVKLLSGQSIIEGEALGIDDRGALRMSVEGVERSFSGGELSLRLSDDS